jgi:hypothetical protein
LFVETMGTTSGAQGEHRAGLNPAALTAKVPRVRVLGGGGGGGGGGEGGGGGVGGREGGREGGKEKEIAEEGGGGLKEGLGAGAG